MSQNFSSQDPFDEFEFKPLTSGLGFHKKNDFGREINNEIDPKKNFNIEDSPSAIALDRPFDFNQKTTTHTPDNASPFTPPLPRPGASSKASASSRNEVASHLTARPVIAKSAINVPIIEDDSITKAQTAVNEILKNLNHKKQQEDLLLKNQKTLAWRNTRTSVAASLLDLMLITAMFLICLIGLISITKIDLLSNLLNPGADHQIWLATGGLFMAITFIYTVASRTYLTFTPGEWAFDLRCGTDVQLSSAGYALRIILRSVVTIATGLITLPILSILINKDIAGKISGVQLQKLTYQ